ncbi:uncharacterized protein LOC126568412 [Anopheles maculipalpis]|uniref:uncharacterized protein LOC126568412 n=1 Tax=Anopheles maculipalpis TaxID=1496333 RepID=UPI002159A13D|nr:uncharacterized protein LOC126568412 [Anopheles maculipalpis]
MTPADFDSVAKHVYINLEHINRYLGKAKIASKFHTTSDELPATLLALTKEDIPEVPVKAFDPLERPSEEEIDTLFDTIRSRSSQTSNGTGANKQTQRHGSFKKTTAAPLQQSRLLNDTNLIANSTSSLTGSCSDMTALVNKSSKQPAIDVELLVDRLRQSIAALGAIENGKIECIDLAQMRQQFRREWAANLRACRNVEALLDEFKQQTESNGSVTMKKEPLISSELVKSMKQLQTKLHYAISIKKADVLPDMTKTLSKDVFPLSECLDTIDETIREKQL